MLLILMLLPFVAMAQNANFSEMFAKYSNKQGFTTVELSREALKAMGVSGGIDSLRAITVEDAELLPSFNADAEAYVANMKRIMAVANSGNNVNIYSQSNKIVVIYTHGAKSATLVCLAGENIELSQMPKLLGGR